MENWRKFVLNEYIDRFKPSEKGSLQNPFSQQEFEEFRKNPPAGMYAIYRTDGKNIYSANFEGRRQVGGSNVTPLPAGPDVKPQAPAPAQPTAATQTNPISDDDFRLPNKTDTVALLLTGQWGTEQKPYSTEETLKKAINFPNVDQRLAGKTLYYKDATGSVKPLAIPATSKQANTKPTLKLPKNARQDVVELQTALNAYYASPRNKTQIDTLAPTKFSKLGIDGIYGKDTRAAVQQIFQKENLGSIAPLTIKQITEKLKALIQVKQENIDRLIRTSILQKISEILEERKLSSYEKKKKEKIVKGLKSSKKDFEKRYPGRGEEVMYATAAKEAKKKKKKK